MSDEERDQYDLVLEEEAVPFEEQAIALHEENAARLRQGLYDDGVKASLGALAELLPARFGKTELVVPWSHELKLGAEASAAYQRGAQLRDAGKLEEAQTAFAESASLEPRAAAPLNELGLVQRAQGLFDAAAHSFSAALAVDPEYAPALRNLGVLRDIYQDDPSAALELFEKYQALTGEDRPVTSWIADVKQRAGKHEAPPTEVL
jgi:tetratricopeptide (TPR) repeat protein